MCWNAQVSLNTFMVASFATIIALSNGVMTPWGAAFLMTYSSMQLVEHFAWKHIDDPAKIRLISTIALTLVVLEALVSIMKLSEGGPAAVRTRNVLLPCFVVFAVGMLYYSKHIDFRMTAAPNGHLRWHWLEVSPMVLTMWMLLFFIPLMLHGSRLLFAFTALCVMVSMATYWSAGTWGTMWCWVAGAASVYYIGLALVKSGMCKP